MAEVFDTYVYTLGITQGAFSYSTAVGMFKSVVATVMVLTTNWICKNVAKQAYTNGRKERQMLTIAAKRNIGESN